MGIQIFNALPENTKSQAHYANSKIFNYQTHTTFLAILFLSACATTKIKIVDDNTGKSIADAFVYIKPMHLLPFPMCKLNILSLSDKNGNVFTSDSSFYLYAGKHGYGLTNSYDYDSKEDLYIVRLKRETNIKIILFNGSKSDFDSLKNNTTWKSFLDYCKANDIIIKYID